MLLIDDRLFYTLSHVSIHLMNVCLDSKTDIGAFSKMVRTTIFGNFDILPQNWSAVFLWKPDILRKAFTSIQNQEISTFLVELVKIALFTMINQSFSSP